MKHLMKKISLVILVGMMMFAGFSSHVFAINKLALAKPSQDGQLHVEGTSLANAKNEKVVLQGISTHGLNWYPDYVNEDLFQQLAEEWRVNVVRLAMYESEYLKNKKENLQILERGIKAAIKADMYIMVDWHMLGHFSKERTQASKVFFDDISKRYANDPHILYEICNEPMDEGRWEAISAYANQIIPVIRKNSPQSVVIVGTPDYDQDLASAMKKPLDFENIMYSFHFYTASHHDQHFHILQDAVSSGFPVYISECGITEADGNGRADYEYARKWFTYLYEQKISYVVWNLSNKKETSSFIKASSGAKKHLSDKDLTDTGLWIRALLQGEDPQVIPAGAAYQSYSFLDIFKIQIFAFGYESLKSIYHWPVLALISGLILLAFLLIKRMSEKKAKKACRTYDDIMRLYGHQKDKKTPQMLFKRALIYALMFMSMIYLLWRIMYSINTKSGPLPIICNLLLFIVEVIGFLESGIHYGNMLNLKKHELPRITEEEYPDVDIFIATYNEPEELLRKTVNGCKHLKYPDPAKVHIWICDDNRRATMRQLANEMGVGYFDRPDNKGAKAGNLNAAMARTQAPYVVTLDADMIVQSDFLMKTIPYFVHVEKCCADLPESEKKHLGLLQTPQCFYDPDVFQYALYSENNIPNEQDFFYRTIEVGKASTNSVIYGGSNTILSRRALEQIGGFYTESITEDFATGMLIEAAGFVSLAIGEPLASGKTPNTFEDHIKQRTRWGRGVINTAKHLHLFKRADLYFEQKLSYLSSVIYWYSPIKNLIYVLSPLFFATFMIPVFRCNWIELLVFWMPMFILQDLCLRIVGDNTISLIWSGIYEMSVMPYLLMPVIKETFGISLSKFQVTDKSKKTYVSKKTAIRTMMPFIVLFILSVFGLIRVIMIMNLANSFSMIIILFWLIRNLYSIVMVMLMINGRESDEDIDSAIVKSGEMMSVTKASSEIYEGISTVLTEHSVQGLLDSFEALKVGDVTRIHLETEKYEVELQAIVTNIRPLRFSDQCICRMEILDYLGQKDTYLQVIYDRVPTLPQSLGHDFGFLTLLWRNLIFRAARTL